MAKFIGSTNLTYLWGKIKNFVSKATVNRAVRIPFGVVDSTSIATAFTATVDGIPMYDAETSPTLADGTCVYLSNPVVNSAAKTTTPKCWTLDVNGYGAKPVYVTTAAATYSTTHFTKNYKMLFTYDDSLNSGNGGWYIGQLFNSNTTYSDMTQAEINAGTGTTGRKITPKMLRDNFYTEDEVDGLLDDKQDTIDDLADIRSGAALGATALQSFTESDPVFTASAAHGITSSDISNWNSKTSNVGTITGINMNGASKGTSGVVDLGTVLTSQTKANWNETNSSSDAYIQNKPTIPTALADLTEDSSHKVVSQTSITTWNDKAEKVTQVNHGTSDTTYTITPNVLHVWGEVTSLNLTLGTGENGVVNEYMFQFYSGNTPTTLTLPNSVIWVQPLTTQAGKTYQVSIVNNLACYITDGMAAAESSGGTPTYATQAWVTSLIDLVPTVNSSNVPSSGGTYSMIEEGYYYE